jgi:hypothetical protein
MAKYRATTRGRKRRYSKELNNMDHQGSGMQNKAFLVR